MLIICTVKKSVVQHLGATRLQCDRWESGSSWASRPWRRCRCGWIRRPARPRPCGRTLSRSPRWCQNPRSRRREPPGLFCKRKKTESNKIQRRHNTIVSSGKAPALRVGDCGFKSRQCSIELGLLNWLVNWLFYRGSIVGSYLKFLLLQTSRFVVCLWMETMICLLKEMERIITWLEPEISGPNSPDARRGESERVELLRIGSCQTLYCTEL